MSAFTTTSQTADSQGKRRAYVTVCLSNNEAVGALVLAKSIRQTGTLETLVCLIDTKQVECPIKQALEEVFDNLIPIELDEQSNELLQQRGDLTQAIFRIQCWRLSQFDICVYLDPACLVLQNTQELFDRGEFSACPDTKWPDHFNAGVFVFCPSEQTYNNLIEQAKSSLLVDVSFQGILNNYFCKWATEDIAKHLPFIYNVTPNVFYTYQPAVRSFKENVRIVQFSQEPRPWNTTYDVEGNCVDEVSGEQQHFYTSWWKAFNVHVKPLLDSTCHQCVRLTERIHLLSSSASTGQSQQDASHSGSSDNDRYAWETGRIDYMGKDSFENIKKKLDQSIHE